MSSVGNVGVLSGARGYGRSTVSVPGWPGAHLGLFGGLGLEKRCQNQGWMQGTIRDTVFVVER